MEFENNFVYPFSSTMYDATLKIRVALSSYKESYRREDGTITIYYNKNIRSDNLIVPLTDSELEFRRRYHAPGSRITTAKPFTEGEKKFSDIPYEWSVNSDIILLKISKLSGIFPYLVQGARLEIPEFAESLSDLYLYIIRNYINLPMLREYCFSESMYPHAKRMEICITKDDCMDLFKIDLCDCTEIEKDWFSVASRELDR